MKAIHSKRPIVLCMPATAGSQLDDSRLAMVSEAYEKVGRLKAPSPLSRP